MKGPISVEAPPGLGKMEPLMECLTSILQEQDVRAKMEADADGFLSIQWLLSTKPALSMKCNGDAKCLVTAIENQDGPIQLDEGRRRLRWQSCTEQLLAEAKRLMKQMPFGVVPIASFFALPSLSQMLHTCGQCDAEGFLRKALMHEDSELLVQGSFVAWQPRNVSTLRKSIERLFLDQDPQLREKIQQTGEVPLTWILGRYAERLGVQGHYNDVTSEELALEIASALVDSEVLRVDRRSLTVRKCRSPERAPEEIRPGENQEGSQVEGQGARRGSSRAASQLRQLLDFYFEPFTLQHNRYLLDLILKRADAPEDKGPWRAEALQNCHFTLEDLKGLGRIQSALSKLQTQKSDWMEVAELGNLKHLSSGHDGTLYLRTQLEVRSFVHADNVPKDVAVAAVRYLTASKEQQQEAPKGVVNVLSYSISDALTDQSPSGQQRLAKVKRQVLVYRTDLICLQGLDINEEVGANLAKSLTDEGYGIVCSSFNGKANSILWDQRRWELLSSSEDTAVAVVNLRPYEDPASTLRVVCWQANVHSASGRLFAAHEKVLVCTDLSAVGGTEGAGIVDELVGLPSVAEEVLGEEVASHIPAPPGLSLECDLGPVHSNGQNRLRHPDAMFFQNMAPVAVLSGHSSEYLTSMPQKDVVQQFPCFRLPIVAAFDWQNPETGAKRDPIHATDSVRL